MSRIASPITSLERPFDFESLLYRVVRTSAVLLPAVVLAGFLVGGWATYSGFLVVFVFYFLVELTLHWTGLGVATTRANEFKFERGPAGHLAAQAPLYLYAVLQIAVIAGILIMLPGRAFTTHEIVGVVLSLGAMAGSVGGLAGHEFIHRSAPHARLLGVAVYGSVNYAHFRVSHLGGHHRNVGLHEDWSTARRGETLYGFLLRAVFAGAVGAFRLEATRLRRAGRSAWSPASFVIRYAAFQALLWSAIGCLLGPTTLLVFLLASALAVCLMETVNYLSHYGLERHLDADGHPEPVQNRHSWESNNKVTNWFIFNAGKHCHHHRRPAHTHDELTLSHEKPYLPHGLPLMTIIALVPPLYFRIMNRLLDAPSRNGAS